MTRQGLRGNWWGREGERRCGSHPGRQRKLDLEIRLRLLIVVRHAAGRHKREIDRSSAPLWDCGAADRIGIGVVFSQKWCSFFTYAFKCILMHSDAFSTISLHSIPLHSSPAAWHCIHLHFDAFTYVAFWYWCICLPSYAFLMLHLVQGAFVCIQMHPFLDAFS